MQELWAEAHFQAFTRRQMYGITTFSQEKSKRGNHRSEAKQAPFQSTPIKGIREPLLYDDEQLQSDKMARTSCEVFNWF